MTETVLFEERPAGRRRMGVATLNVPRKLNALDLGMIERLQPQLQRWREDPDIALVLLRGAGERGFCAGGDVRQVALAAASEVPGDADFAERYFAAEYRLDYLIHGYGKPVLVWGSGIVMGGGIGLMVGGSHRIATPSSLFAMPEITIGLFPDVGASWFLNRMPGRCGLYLGLTGARMDAADACFAGLADHALADDSQPELFERIAGAAWSGQPLADHERLTGLLRPLQLPPAESALQARLQIINRLTDHALTPELVHAILEGSAGDVWLADNAARLRKGSPTSAWLIHEQIRRGRRQSLRESLLMEAGLAVQCSRRHDFREGVRALLVDKDNAPTWRPSSFADVDPADIAAHFSSPWPADRHPLAQL